MTSEHHQADGQRRRQESPIGPHSQVQNVAEATTATGTARRVAVDQRLDYMTDERLDHKEQGSGPNQHRPARVDGGGERERKRR